MPSKVSADFNKFENQCWNSFKEYSLNHPQRARVLSVAAAVGTLFKWMSIYPAHGWENVDLACRTFRHCTVGNLDYKILNFKKGILHLFKGVFGLTAGIPIGLCVGAFYAGQVFISTLIHPLKTAQIKAGESHLNALLASFPEESDIATMLNNLFMHQKKHFESLTNDEEIARYQFLDVNTVRNVVNYKLGELERIQRMHFNLVRAFLGEDGELDAHVETIGKTEEGFLMRKNRLMRRAGIPENVAPQPLLA